MEEIFPIMDESGEVVGSATRRKCHSGLKLLHPVVHLHVFNKSGQLYLQHRSPLKDIQPDKWDTSVGGHVDYGEAIEDALHREAREELGITFNTAIPLFKYIFESAVEREYVHSFAIITDECINFDKVEISEGRFFDISEIDELLGKNFFTPNFEKEFEMIKNSDFLSENF